MQISKLIDQKLSQLQTLLQAKRPLFKRAAKLLLILFPLLILAGGYLVAKELKRREYVQQLLKLDHLGQCKQLMAIQSECRPAKEGAYLGDDALCDFRLEDGRWLKGLPRIGPDMAPGRHVKICTLPEKGAAPLLITKDLQEQMRQETSRLVNAL